MISESVLVAEKPLLTEAELKRKIRAELPPEAFIRQPYRALSIIPLVTVSIVGILLVILAPLPWYIDLLLAVVIGNVFAATIFFGHEVGHGAVVHSRWLQDLILYIACTPFCLSPHMWRVWHNQVHHGNTNLVGRDPDSFGTLEEYYQLPPLGRSVYNTLPGSGHILSLGYLFLFFTIHVQSILWIHSHYLPGMERLNRKRAITDSAIMLLFWVALGIWAGPWAALCAIILPILFGNTVLFSYIFTNHMLRPLTDTHDTLSTTMSVTTHWLLDRFHFNFSHHVEHHLFPGMGSNYYPMVRESLRRLVPDQYMSPPHPWAVRMIFDTPRIYDGFHILVEPTSGRRVKIADIEMLMQDVMS